MQALIIRSALEWVYRHEHNIICVIPEAWKFIPASRQSPVSRACERLIREGAALGNYLWLDSQDLAGVHKEILRQVGVWVMGVQREVNEAQRALDHIPVQPKPRVDEVMRLKRGQFFVCHGNVLRKVYVRPGWMSDAAAYLAALGNMDAAPRPRL